MKYLLGFLEGLEEGPSASDVGFQKLLQDVQAGKTNAKSADAFYESLEKIVNELKSTTESGPFQKPVSRREAPDYYDVVTKPMDLQTIMKNVKMHKYKTKAEFVADLDLIWDNCAFYNTLETHPVRVAARFMKQKADHHLEFLADKTDKSATQPLLFPLDSSSASNRQLGVPSSLGHFPSHPSPLRTSSQLPGGDEDAAGESDDAMGEEIFLHEASAGPSSHTVGSKQGKEKELRSTGEADQRDDGQGGASGSGRGRGRGRSGSASAAGHGVRNGSRGRRDDRSASISGRAGPSQPSDITPSRPKLQTSLENSHALIRTPQAMSIFQPFSLFYPPSPSSIDKGKGKEILSNTSAPAWWPAELVDEEQKMEGSWWGLAGKNEGYTSGLPGIPFMPFGEGIRRGKIPKHKKRRRVENGIPRINEDGPGHSSPKTPPKMVGETVLKIVDLEEVIHDSVDKLCEARRLMTQTMEFQRIEAEGGVLPMILEDDERESARLKKVERVRKRKIKVEERERRKRRKVGGEIGEEEAVEGMKRVTAGLLAHAGFEGANEIPLDLMTRVAIDHIRGMGRTLRLFMDGFSQKMAPDEIILHALHEHGQVQTQDLEAYIKDDVERENVKITEMAKKVKQAYKEIATAPAIEDDMLLADGGEMLIDGNFANELGEDFLGLRDLGIEEEHSLSSLNIPSSLFYGRKKRAFGLTQNGSKAELPDYPPPPPFVPLDPSTLSTHLPALLHAFYASRMDSGLSIREDDPFDPTHSVVGSLGQIVVKNPNTGVIKKKREREEKGEVVKKPKIKKLVQPGVGKGNWIRPSKEERQRRALEKRRILENRAQANGAVNAMSGVEDDAMGEEVDAEGEEE